LLGASAVAGQKIPPVSIVDLYGLEGKVDAADVLKAANIKPGDDPRKVFSRKKDIEQSLREVPGVADASITFVCCADRGGSMIYIGIRETSVPAIAFRPAPSGNVRLPRNIVDLGKQFDKAFDGLVKKGDLSEQDRNGAAYFADPAVNAILQQFPEIAGHFQAELHAVIRDSSDAKERALAAQVIAYHTDKKQVVDDLVYASSDPDADVRNNATRALMVISNYSLDKPGLGIQVPFDGFIALLNSISWTDRNKSLGLLDSMTQRRDPALLAKLRREALPSLRDAAMWKNPGHAQWAFYILGRVAGMDESQIDKLWSDGDRETPVREMYKRALNLN
jgi:hypothetical protein